MEHLRRLVQDLAVAGYQLDRSAYEYLTAMREAQATTPAKKISARVKVTRDPSKEIGGGGSIEDFSHYFRDRFQKLGGAFRERQDARDASTIDVALKAA